ncbi:MAG: dihydropteroate synthase [Verrucomicrobia bacterium]|nr:dihydropteroate synthase [Verrucomicrobiota bacterium]
MIWRSRQRTLDLSRRAAIVGILNVTPDSFSDGGRHDTADLALTHARRMVAEGARIIDIGGESTRPGALPVTADEEIRRTLPVIRALRHEWDGWISIDTSKAAVAEAAIQAGADVVNDVSGLRADPGMPALCADAGVAVVVMHMQGSPQTMQQAPQYDDVVAELRAFFAERLESLIRAGLAAESICVDPGIGFGKQPGHNLALLRSLDILAPVNQPLMIGLSRKSLIGAILGDTNLALRDWPTVALTAAARRKGVMLHRVHAVKPCLDAVRMIEAIDG